MRDLEPLAGTTLPVVKTLLVTPCDLWGAPKEPQKLISERDPGSRAGSSTADSSPGKTDEDASVAGNSLRGRPGGPGSLTWQKVWETSASRWHPYFQGGISCIPVGQVGSHRTFCRSTEGPANSSWAWLSSRGRASSAPWGVALARAQAWKLSP